MGCDDTETFLCTAGLKAKIISTASAVWLEAYQWSDFRKYLPGGHVLSASASSEVPTEVNF